MTSTLSIYDATTSPTSLYPVASPLQSWVATTRESLAIGVHHAKVHSGLVTEYLSKAEANSANQINTLVSQEPNLAQGAP